MRTPDLDPDAGGDDEDAPETARDGDPCGEPETDEIIEDDGEWD